MKAALLFPLVLLSGCTARVVPGVAEHGLVPPYAPAGYESDMPGFAGKLSDEEIRAVLAYIRSRWSGEVLKLRAQMLQK